MPRPKRTKIVSTSAHPTAPPAPTSKAPKQLPQLRQLQQSPSTASRRFDSVSSDSDRLVSRSASLRKAGRIPTQLQQDDDGDEHDVTLSGALGRADEVHAHYDDDFRRRVSQERREELKRANKVTRDPTRRKQDISDNAKAQKQPAATKRQSAILRNADTNEVERVTESFSTVMPTQSQTQQPIPSAPPSVAKVPPTPSFLSHFRKRPRQNSLLDMVQAAAATRENSIMGDGDERDLDDEPSVLTLGGLSVEPSPSAATAERSANFHSSSSKKRKRGENGGDKVLVRSSATPPSSPPARRARSSRSKRDSLQTNEPAARTSTVSPAAPPPQLPEEPTEEASEDDDDLPALRHAPVTKTNSAAATTPKPKRRSRRRRTPSPVQGTSPASTPSPEPAKPARAGVPSRAKPVQRPTMTTKALQSLLPRRRRPLRQRARAGSFSILSDGESAGSEDDSPLSPEDDADDADELTAQPARGRRFGAKADANAAPPARGRPGQKTYTRARAGAGAGESPLRVRRTGKAGAKSAATVAPPEMDAAARKFAEVDAWEMSFESADVGGGSSSPWR